VKTVRINSLVGALYLGLALGGCATTQQAGQPVSDQQRAPESKRHNGPNPGAQLGAGCARIAIEGPLRGGLVVMPVTTVVAALCLPAALGVGVIHAVAPDLRLANGVVPDTGPVVIRQLSDAERSAFPQSWAGGCAWGSDCYSYQGANKSSAEMRKLTYTERSAFPRPFAAGCAAGYGC